MFKFIISQFINKEKALEKLEEHQEKIEKISEKNPHLATAVKTGFKLWSIWKIILFCWSIFLVICVF